MSRLERKYLAHYIDASFNNGQFVRGGTNLFDECVEMDSGIFISVNSAGNNATIKTIGDKIRCVKLEMPSWGGTMMAVSPAIATQIRIAAFADEPGINSEAISFLKTTYVEGYDSVLFEIPSGASWFVIQLLNDATSVALDISFDDVKKDFWIKDTSPLSQNYVRLGKDFEAYAEELNPQVDVRRNIIGEQNVYHSGYQAQSNGEPFYAELGDPMFTALSEFANKRFTGDRLLTTRIDALYRDLPNGLYHGKFVWCYREDCWVVPNSVGGDTSGVQIPFTVYNAGNRVPGRYRASSGWFEEGRLIIRERYDGPEISSVEIPSSGNTRIIIDTGDVGPIALMHVSVSDEQIASLQMNDFHKSATISGVSAGETDVVFRLYWNSDDYPDREPMLEKTLHVVVI